MALHYRDGSLCDGRVTESDLAREDRSEAVIAWFDGWGQANGMRPMTFPRRLDRSELAAWREGWSDAHRERREHLAAVAEAEGRLMFNPYRRTAP